MKNLSGWYSNFNISQILILVGFHKTLREHFHTQSHYFGQYYPKTILTLR